MAEQVVERKRRYFGGELNVHVNYKGTPEEIRTEKDKRNLEKKHLRAYLKGDKEFSFGKDAHGNSMIFKVSEIWK